MLLTLGCVWRIGVASGASRVSTVSAPTDIGGGTGSLGQAWTQRWRRERSWHSLVVIRPAMEADSFKKNPCLAVKKCSQLCLCCTFVRDYSVILSYPTAQRRHKHHQEMETSQFTSQRWETMKGSSSVDSKDDCSAENLSRPKPPSSCCKAFKDAATHGVFWHNLPLWCQHWSKEAHGANRNTEDQKLLLTEDDRCF